MNSYFQNRLFKLLLVIAPLAGAFFLWSYWQSQKNPEVIYDKPSKLPDFTTSNQPQIKVGSHENTQPELKQELPESGLQTHSPVIQEKMKKFIHILKSKNDNDPALDSEFRHLSTELKSAMMDLYRRTANELRNERGTIAFLIARDVQSVNDLEFLQKIFAETPCLSLADCSSAGNEDSHFSGMNQTSLNYPQLASLYQLDRQFQERPQLLRDPVFLDSAKSLVKQAELFPVPAVQKKAEELRNKYHLD